MTLIVNGSPRPLPEGESVADLITDLGLDGKRVAVELNREIVLQEHFTTTSLKDGDSLEIVQFVGGG